MPVPAGPSIPLKARDLLTNALIEIGAYSVGEGLSADDAKFALSKLNRMLDGWNAQQIYIFNVNFLTFNIKPNHQPHTIGDGANVPAPDFATVGNRPTKIEAASIILNNLNPAVKSPLRPRDDAWWAQQRVPGVATTLPSDLYYSPKWPNGEIFLWPVPTVAYQLELECWNNVDGFANLDVVFFMPPGYEEAVTLSLAERLCPAFGKSADAQLQRDARNARVVITNLNSTAPRISTLDAGMPSANQNRSTFNYRTKSNG